MGTGIITSFLQLEFCNLVKNGLGTQVLALDLIFPMQISWGNMKSFSKRVKP